MKTLLTLLLLAASAYAQTATITDTIATPFAGTFSGTVTVTLNSPALAQPLYSGNVTLSGWTQTVTVTAGAFTLTLYTNDLITPGGTSYTATYAPTSGSGWKETWIVPTGATTIREIRSTTVPSPSVRFTPSQITQAGATLGQGLRWNGSIWAPAAVLTDPMTTTGDLITRSGINAVRVGIGSTGQVLTVSGGMPVWASGITGNASTASALAANGTNCSAGSFPLGVDASGNAESCTAAVTASTGLSDSADIVRGASTLTTVGSVPFVTSAGVLGSEAAFSWDAANNRLGVGIANPGFLTHFVGIAGTDNGWSRTTWQDATNTTRSNWVNGVGFTTIGTITADAMVFAANNVEAFRINPTTRNVSVGTTTDDGANRLQVAGSMRLATTANGTPVALALSATGTGSDATVDTVGSGAYMYLRSTLASPYAGTQINKTTNTVLWFTGTQGLDTYGWFTGSSLTRLASLTTGGTFTLYNETPTTGSTSLVVRAGAGQSGNLQTWQNSAGSTLASVTSNGGMFAPEFENTNSNWSTGNNVQRAGSAFVYRFSSTTLYGGTPDLSLSRASANVLQVGDGSANSNGTILARIHTWANGTEGTCDATLRGQVVMVQGGAGVADRLRLCRKDATDTYLWAPADNNVALQVVSAGPTATVTNQVRRVYVDPASVIASLTLTLPAAPLDADQVQVYFGGTLANRAAVVTTLSIAPNTGHAISQFNAPANAFGGDMVTYEYRADAARWYRIQ